ncbi:MAG: GNAT family N-acetyltransferase [Clostridia bacterium]|nr:GNAT family N-acetyltransferase [Clostridia bacterium]
MDQIERIREMENRFDISTETLAKLVQALDVYEENRQNIRRVAAYYESSQWRKDYEDDEAGRIPNNIKRGVLSQDSVYDLLTLHSDLKKRMKQLGESGNKTAEPEMKMLVFRSLEELDFKRLMRIYAEGNLENARDLYPDEDKKTALGKAIEDFRSYLKTRFFRDGKESYHVLSVGGEWVAALRLYELPDHLFYMEALETEPSQRRHGFASQLLHVLIDSLKEAGPFSLCDCVGKKNIASLAAHLKCGFRIVRTDGYSYLDGETNPYTYGLEYRYSEQEGSAR